MDYHWRATLVWQPDVCQRATRNDHRGTSENAGEKARDKNRLYVFGGSGSKGKDTAHKIWL